MGMSSREDRKFSLPNLLLVHLLTSLDEPYHESARQGRSKLGSFLGLLSSCLLPCVPNSPRRAQSPLSTHPGPTRLRVHSQDSKHFGKSRQGPLASSMVMEYLATLRSICYYHPQTRLRVPDPCPSSSTVLYTLGSDFLV